MKICWLNAHIKHHYTTAAHQSNKRHRSPFSKEIKESTHTYIYSALKVAAAAGYFKIPPPFKREP
jgi:RNase P subunit RPR2